MWFDYWLQSHQCQWHSWERNPGKRYIPVTNSVLNFYQFNLYRHFGDCMHVTGDKCRPFDWFSCCFFLRKKRILTISFCCSNVIIQTKEPPISHCVWELLSSSAHRDIPISTPHANFISPWALFVLRNFMHSCAATAQASLVNAPGQVWLRYYSSSYAFVWSPLGLILLENLVQV